MAAPVTISRLVKIEPAILSAEIQRHLGGCLAAKYGQGDEASSLDQFADLLARLNAALAEVQGSDELVLRTGLLEAAPYLFRFAMSLTRDRTAAGDLVQDTMLRAWRSRRSFQAGTNLNAWLSTIMRNRFYTVRRKHTQEVADIDGDHAARLTSLPEQGGHLDLQDLQAALGRLSPPLREALTLVTLENVSYEDAARIMNCQMGTVKSRVWRARQELASILGYTGAEIGADGAMLSAVGMSGRAVEAG